MIELLSPSQIGPASTRMSAAFTCSKISGQSSFSQPCSRMSGHTPVAMSWSIARTTSTCTPCCSMMWRLASTRAWVLLGSGERLRVQLMNRALRSAPYVASGTVVGWVMLSPRAGRLGGVGNGSQELGVLLDAEQCRPGGGEEGGHGVVQLFAAGHRDAGGAAQLG